MYLYLRAYRPSGLDVTSWRTSAPSTTDRLFFLSSPSLSFVADCELLLLPFNWKNCTQHRPQDSVRHPKLRSHEPHLMPAHTALAPPDLICQRPPTTDAAHVDLDSSCCRWIELSSIVSVFSICSRCPPFPACYIQTGQRGHDNAVFTGPICTRKRYD